MQNIQIICEKILNGPTAQSTNPMFQVDTGFLDILATLTQNTDSNLVELPTIKDTESEEKIEMTDEMFQKALIHFWINNGSIPINDKVQITNEELLKIESILKLNHTNQNQMMEFTQGDYEVENDTLVNQYEFKLKEMIRLNPEKIVIETSEKNEIQKHFKVLNQPVKIKGMIKQDELNSLNQSIKSEFDVFSKDVELTNLQMNEFKQSIEEMQAVIEGMSKKEDQTIVFKLKPEGLAEIVIKFEQKLGKVVLDISTPNKMVEQLIQKELPNLRDSLKTFQMEVNLNEMSFKNSDQSQQPKYYQERQVFRISEEELIEESIIVVPQSYGFNTYV